jgi:hypothetical protein
MKRWLCCVVAGLTIALSPALVAAQAAPSLDAVITKALAVREGEAGTPAQVAAIAAYHEVLAQAQAIDRAALGLDEQVDHDLLMAHVRTRLFEMETLRLHEVNPAMVFALGQTNALFLRPGALPDSAVRGAVAELQRLPAVLARAKLNLKNPARTWTENGLVQAGYARLLLRDYVPKAVVDSAALKAELVAAVGPALAAVDDFERWLQRDLLPRSTRSPAWKPEDFTSVTI